MSKKALLVLCLLIFAFQTGSASAEHVIDDSKAPSFLFVLTGPSGSLEGDSLTLNGVSNVTYFSDRPTRVAGHMSVSKFMEIWDKETGSGKSALPNGVLSILTEDGNENVVVKLKRLTQKNGSIEMTVELIKGSAPENFKAASLFIDPVGPGGEPPLDGG